MNPIIAESIIVYRSKSEQIRDEFWIDTAFPWMYTHWYLFVVAVILISIYVKIINRKS